MNTSSLFGRRPVIVSALAAVALLAGCASAPDVRPTLLTLPRAESPAASPPAGAGRAVTIARLDIPEYLVSRRVRYRTDDSTLAEWPDTFWAERVEVGMSREFTTALRTRLPGWRVCETQCSEWSPAAGLRVVIDRMDYSRPDRRLVASARIVAMATGPAPRGTSHQRREYTLSARADTPQAQAAAYAELLERLATDAAAAVQEATAATGTSPNRGER